VFAVRRIWRYQRANQNTRRTYNTMAKRKRTYNTMAKRKRTNKDLHNIHI